MLTIWMQASRKLNYRKLKEQSTLLNVMHKGVPNAPGDSLQTGFSVANWTDGQHLQLVASLQAAQLADHMPLQRV